MIRGLVYNFWVTQGFIQIFVEFLLCARYSSPWGGGWGWGDRWARQIQTSALTESPQGQGKHDFPKGKMTPDSIISVSLTIALRRKVGATVTSSRLGNLLIDSQIHLFCLKGRRWIMWSESHLSQQLLLSKPLVRKHPVWRGRARVQLPRPLPASFSSPVKRGLRPGGGGAAIPPRLSCLCVCPSQVFPREVINYTAENIYKWALENRETLLRWLRPHGGKSLLLNNELKKGPALFVFIPFNPLAESHPLIDEVRATVGRGVSEATSQTHWLRDFSRSTIRVVSLTRWVAAAFRGVTPSCKWAGEPVPSWWGPTMASPATLLTVSQVWVRQSRQGGQTRLLWRRARFPLPVATDILERCGGTGQHRLGLLWPWGCCHHRHLARLVALTTLSLAVAGWLWDPVFS